MTWGSLTNRILASQGGQATPPAARLRYVGTSSPSASCGPFTSADYWLGTNGPELSVGNTIVILFQIDSIVTGGVHLCGNSAATTARGWYLRLLGGQGSVGGEYGVVRVSFFGGTGEMTSGHVRYTKGLNCIAITRASDGSIRLASNGGPTSVLHASPTYVPASSGSTHAVGRSHVASPATNSRVIEYAWISAELSDTDLSAVGATPNNIDSYTLPPLVRSHPSLQWSVHFGEDWDGTTSPVVAGRGSSPATFTRQGTLSKTIIGAEDWYEYDADYVRNTAPAVDQGSYYLHDAWASIELFTDSSRVRASCRQTATWANWYSCGCDVNNVWADSAIIDVAPAATKTVDFSGLTASMKHVRLYTGLHTSGRLGSFMAGRVAVLAGSTVLDVPPVPPGSRVVVHGDSISVGQDSWSLPEYAWSLILRRDLADWGVTNDGFGSRRLGLNIGNIPALGANICTRFDGRFRNVLLYETATVDWGNGTPASQWAGWLATLVDTIHTLRPDVEVVFLQPFTRSNEDTPNAGGSTLQDYRDAEVSVASTRPWISVLNGPSMLVYPTDYDPDLLHLANSGAVKVSSAVFDFLTT